ncbi:hypothetical protein [Rubripirellula reticaptiva]|uniref:Uncharacterized protein n=1 Tax=Rubripirellula reticaptiva TaxID=2528013 RepID=A0A5C6EWB0_9BACT|nr:hypothetical protein [Rubripirellula reticaptiva]TWU51521.1 hypothetical protein Poly59_31130 [Rubripirellula reticaptiva]
MAHPVLIEHQPPDGWKVLTEEFLIYCYNECGIASPGLHEGDCEYRTADGRTFKQVMIPDHQWHAMYPAFKSWIAATAHCSAWIEHGRIWISDDTSQHLRECERIPTDQRQK